METLQKIKKLLSEDKYRIQLYDYLYEKCSAAIDLIDEKIEVPSKSDPEEFSNHLDIYENSTLDLISAMALIGFWGASAHRRLFSLSSRYFRQHLVDSASGSDPWSGLRWYPLVLQMYALGLGSVSSNCFGTLLGFLQMPVPDPSSRMSQAPQIMAITSGIAHARERFKSLPNHTRHYAPLSEYLFDFFADALGDVLFFGDEYEYTFDRFEVLLALQHSHEYERLHEGRYRGPIGRFGWKFQRLRSENPYADVCREASRAKESWPPIRAGFFGASFDRFAEIASKQSEHLQKLPWH